jgi:HD-GYP domain-containing protein (c-di-GMP phosphodiesterase class II)
MERIVLHDDPLAGLATAATFGERLAIVHTELRQRCPGVVRLAVALHDRQTGALKTFAASPNEQSPLRNYEVAIDDARSLKEVAARRCARIVHDLAVFDGDREHAQRIRGHGFASSYTLPIFQGHELTGFVFCNSLHKGYFRNGIVAQVEPFTHLVVQLVLHDQSMLATLNAALRMTVGMVHVRDPETGNHLERMARYSRLIARELVDRGKSDFNDEQIEQLFNFAPLHDVGKLGIPDSILLKPGKLGEDERSVMDTHPLIGRQMVDALAGNFGFGQIAYFDILRALVEYHHEALDGSGYPHGLSGAQIPLAARIVAVSDVFDALVSKRPYKESWPNPHAIAMLQMLSIDKLDADCVAALIERSDEVARIQRQFADVGPAF